VTGFVVRKASVSRVHNSRPRSTHVFIYGATHAPLSTRYNRIFGNLEHHFSTTNLRDGLSQWGRTDGSVRFQGDKPTQLSVSYAPLWIEEGE